jgi:hypothetical protein
MDELMLIIGFIFGAVYNGLAIHVTDKITNTNFYWMLFIPAMSSVITGIIAYVWPYIFNVSLLCGMLTVFIGLVAFYLYASISNTK